MGQSGYVCSVDELKLSARLVNLVVLKKSPAHSAMTQATKPTSAQHAKAKGRLASSAQIAMVNTGDIHQTHKPSICIEGFFRLP